MNVYTLSYHSRNCLEDLVTDPLPEIEAILQAARSRNEAADVTGALMFSENRFSQILEGSEQDVIAIFASIERDKRHADVTVIGLGKSSSRRFSSWSMAFAGRSHAAQKYYHDYILGRVDWKSLTNDLLYQTMLDMIEFDERPDRKVLV